MTTKTILIRLNKENHKEIESLNILPESKEFLHRIADKIFKRLMEGIK